MSEDNVMDDLRRYITTVADDVDAAVEAPTARPASSGKRHPRRVVAAAAAVFAAAALVAVGVVATGADSDAPVTAGEPQAVDDPQPVFAPTVSVDGPFAVDYRESDLSAETTDNEGQVVQPATLETNAYRLIYRSAEDWEVRNLDTGDRFVYADGVMQDWRGGQVVSEARMDDVAVSAQFAMPLDVDRFHDHMSERGFTQVDSSSDNLVSREVYERLIPKPEGEYYHSLPWLEEGNVDQVTVEYDQSTGRVARYAQRLNGELTYEYELVSVTIPDDPVAGSEEGLFVPAPDNDEASQSAEDAARDGVHPEVASLAGPERSELLVSVDATEGRWALSRPSASAVDGQPVVGDPDGRYGIDWVNLVEYGEILLLDDAGWIRRAYPMPGLVPSWLAVANGYVYAGRVGDGALPASSVVRIDRETLEAEVVVFPASGQETLPDLGWATASDGVQYEDFVTVGSPGGEDVESWIGPVDVDTDAIDRLFESP